MKRLITGLLLVILLLGVFACSKASAPAPAPYPAPAPAPAPIFGGAEEASPAPIIAVPAPTTAPAPAKGASADLISEQSDIQRMIVRTGSMSLIVEDVAKAIEQIVALASSYNGYVVSSNSWRENERLVGNISIRVAVEHFDATIAALRGMAVKVNSESTSGKDVTEEYVDLSAKLRNLEAAETQLLKLMEETGKVTDILEVQRELVKTRGEIEQTKGRMQYLEQSSSLSLVEVNLEQSKLGVEFNASKRSVKTGEKIYFEPRIAGGFVPYSYEWDFGDGITSTSEMPTHAYKSAGSYTVILKVTDDKGYTDSQKRDDYIVVLPGWSAGNIASSAWNGLATFGRVITDIIIWVGIFSPVWIIVGVILYFAWWRRRKKA